jgi:hypothetical protein
MSQKSVWALLKHFIGIVDVLKKELPFDYLTPSWHMEDGAENCTAGIFARWEEKRHSLKIHTHCLDAPPQPKGMYPPDCCAVGTLQISSSIPLPQEGFEVGGPPSGGWCITTTSGFRFPLST